MHEIAPDVFQIPLTPRDGINAYLIGDVLIDTGVSASAGKLAKALDGRSVSAIALTHAHVDHAGSLSKLCGQLGAPAWCGAADREATETGVAVKAPSLERTVLSSVVAAVARFTGTPVARTLVEDVALGHGFVVLDTPGHSPGHVSYWRESDRTLLCGDVFLNMNVLTTVPGLHQPPGVFTPDPAANRAAERRLAALEPATVGFGHGPVLRKDAAARLRAFTARLPG